ncbi:hypothetical protein ACEN8K_43315 [Variovorax sp. CT11-76]
MKKLVLATTSLAIVLAGCAGGGMSDTQRNTAIGAGAGARGLINI